MSFTGYIEMVHPDGGVVRIGHGPTQSSKDGTLAHYRRKGFKTLDEAARDAELADLRAQAAKKKG